MLELFALTDHHRKAQQAAIESLKPGDSVRVELAAPIGGRPAQVHFRSSRGPKGASLGSAPEASAAIIRQAIRGGAPIHGIVVLAGHP